MSNHLEETTKANLEKLNYLNRKINNNKKEGFRKRRFTVGAETLFSKRKRKDDYVPPSAFQQSASKKDPLNLKSIATNESVCQATPEPSPLAESTTKEKVDVVIPTNIRDPLNLVCSKNVTDSALIFNNHNNHNSQRYSRKRTFSETELNSSSLPLYKPKESFKDDSFLFRGNSAIKFDTADNRFKKPYDKIVPPMLPQLQRIRKLWEKNQERKKTPNESLTQVQVVQKPESNIEKSQKKEKRPRFPYGNYNRYYGYRNAKQTTDPRFKLFPNDLFQDKIVLDIGCNVGQVTLQIACDLSPKKILGIDIDPQLIHAARSNIRHYITGKVIEKEHLPTSLPLLLGPVVALPNKSVNQFPNNVRFETENYVMPNDQCLTSIQPLYDTILCLSITKWIHLNWGDHGIKRFFKRIFLELNPGGSLILEPQPWPSYHKKSKLTPEMLQIYRNIRFKPEHFNEFLLKDVGFKSCELLGTPVHNSKGIIPLFKTDKIVFDINPLATGRVHKLNF